MSATQLSFTLRTSVNVKTAHLLGSWDNYSGQLPLSKDTSKSGGWKGTFRFSSSILKPGQRYWYYYIMDGYHVSHDPAQPHTKEPTTGRSLNILDIPRSSVLPADAGAASKRSAANRQSIDIPKGRALSPSKIISPKPSKPYASRKVREADYSASPGLDELSAHLEQASLYGKFGNVSPASSLGSDISSSGGSSLSSLSDPSSVSSRSCRCNRYGVTRKGDRVKLDCGGGRCGYSDSSSDCSSSGDDQESSESEPETRRAPRFRQRLVVR
ncbi:hypothetical protein MMC31_006289 [Peltigera leucophlebia]|nr:hypothetical protein [Peltigera leucophlebia]